MVVIKTLDGDTGAGARPPTPQPAVLPLSWLLTSRTCDDSVTQHALIFCFCFSSAAVCVVTRDNNGISRLPLLQVISPYKEGCVKGSSEIPLLSLVVTRARGSLARRQLQTDFPWSPVTGGGWSLPNVGQGNLCCLFSSAKMRCSCNLYPNYIGDSWRMEDFAFPSERLGLVID